MLDAESDDPVCGDRYAKRFMDEDGLRVFESFIPFTNPNASNVARHRIIDDLLRERLVECPQSRIFLVGCGFDSRAYRLTGGTWIELDEAPLIAYKNQRLPVSECVNELNRLAIDFSTESLSEKLAGYSTDLPVYVVVEGVFMYLTGEQVRRLLDDLQKLFPQHELLCDLMSNRFFVKYSRPIHAKIQALGATFRLTSDRPERVFLESGYRLREKATIVGRAIEFGSMRIPKLIFKLFLRTLADGYAIHVFTNCPCR
ncbi:MAG: class I SAM-dependent methyltransferase [Gammaproteobacteria bacterium]|nr:class I SAM-dependent methyltransferase [Gammaproteobacteria bacterium]